MLEAIMTAKQAIKARCRDCLAGARVCEFTDCALTGIYSAPVIPPIVPFTNSGTGNE